MKTTVKQDVIIDLSVKRLTTEQAKQNLFACGILNRSGNVNSKYKDLFVKKSK